MKWYEILSCSLFFFLIATTIVMCWAEGISKRKPKTKKEKEKQIQKEISAYYANICDACGRYPKQQNSMLCKECEEKVYENKKDV